MIFDDETMRFLRMRAGQLPHQSPEQEIIRKLIENCRKLEEKIDTERRTMFARTNRKR